MNVNGKNAGYALRDEIFKWQDRLDELEYSDEGLVQLYLLTEDILDTLESRLDLNPEFVKEMEELANSDDSEFTKIKLPERSFFDLVNNYKDAKKIGDVVQACAFLIYYVQKRIDGIDCYISDDRLWIRSIDNISLSTSIISELLEIKASNIDDRNSFHREWSIPLRRR